MSQHDQAKNHTETTPIETLLDESGTDEETTTSSYTAPQPAPAPQYALPEFKSGPAPVTALVGLLGLLTAIAVLVAQATDLDIPWGVVGPVAVIGAGVLLAVLGLAGLRGQRFRG